MTQLMFSVNLLIAFTSVAFIAGDPVSSEDCLKDGKIVKNLQLVFHDNNCAMLQCQLGRFEGVFGACGKEFDGLCHAVNSMLSYQNTTYLCQKIRVGLPAPVTKVQYQYQVVTPRTQESCLEGGQTYQSLEKFRRGDGCREYQCQNGVVVPLEAVCGKEIDGNCHVVGEIFEKEGTAYICYSRSVGDEVVYENVVLVPQPVRKRACSNVNYTYQNYETFRQLPNCNLRQCRDKKINILTKECAFKRDDVKCYKVGEQWRLDGRTYVCAINENTQQATTEILVRGQSRCYRSGRWFNHLELDSTSGIQVYQCQDGQTVQLTRSCQWKDNHTWQPLNYVMHDNEGVLIKCVLRNHKLILIPFRVFRLQVANQSNLQLAFKS